MTGSRLLATLILIGATGAVSACGRKAPLDTPYQAQMDARKEAERLKQPAPPEPVLVLRATLRQSTHQFPAALADLDQAVKRNSDDVQAWLTRATVQTVTGDFGAARASCVRVSAPRCAPW